VRVAHLLAGHALPPAVFHPRIAGYEVDFLLEGTDVIIECDGWASHGLQRDQFEFDRTRDAELVAAGYRVVHVTWRQVTEAPHGVARRIRAVLAAKPGSRST
jgi:very-short-patch-repair endonuclease